MAGWKDFREIKAWQYARELKLQVDVFLRRTEVMQRYDSYRDLYRAARSGPGNIAEGFGKFGNKEFARYSRIAKGSEVEVINHLIDLEDQKLISSSERVTTERTARKALKAVTGLIIHLESTPDPPRPKKKSRPPKRQDPSESG
ncbi:MAG TPA: four helix bundle protein [Vicinamibacterales bacterium]